jgi:hypothetical protein
MGLTRILAVYCTGPMMVGVEMEAEDALLELFPPRSRRRSEGREAEEPCPLGSVSVRASLVASGSRCQLILWANGSALRHMRSPMRATSTKPSMHSNGIMLPATGATRWYSRPRARTVIPLGPLRGETEGYVCYSTWFAPRSITAARSGCLALGVGCLFSEVDV